MTSAADHARTDRGRGSARDARTTDAGGPRPRGDGAFDPASVMLELQGAAGNRAVADLVAHAGPRAHPRTLPFSVQRQPPTRKGAGSAGATSGAAGGTTAVKRGGINAPTGGTAAELTTAEAWLRYVALRGNAPAPSAPVPQSYHGIISAVQSAIAGPGPIPASELLLDELAFGDARA